MKILYAILMLIFVLGIVLIMTLVIKESFL